MYRPTARLVALMLIAAAATTGCGPVEVSPLGDSSPINGSATPSPTATPPGTTVTEAPPPATSAAVSRSGTCVSSMFTLDGADSADSPRSLCFTAGGVLRIENVYPDDVSADPADRVSCAWEAGIAMCRFLRAGNATVRIGGHSPSRSIAVVVV
jgi:hypothetical protein